MSPKKIPKNSSFKEGETMISKTDISDQTMYRMMKEGRIDAYVLYGLQLMENTKNYNLGLNLIIYAFSHHKNLLAKEALEKLGLLDTFFHAKNIASLITKLTEENLPSLGITIDMDGYIHFQKNSFASEQYGFIETKYGYILTEMYPKGKFKKLRLPDFIDHQPVIELSESFFEKVKIKELYAPRLLNSINITNYSWNKVGSVDKLHIHEKLQFIELDENFSDSSHNINSIIVDGIIPDIEKFFKGAYLEADAFEIAFNKPYQASAMDTIILPDEALKIINKIEV
jgi:hypothetical protein